MKKRKSCLVAATILLGIGVVVALVTILLARDFWPNWLDQKRALAGPPTVIVHFPTSGDTTPEGILLPASATATGRNPISRIELWRDGELYQQQASEDNAGIFRASFEVELSEGDHMLVFRAIDSNGLVGQSLPIPVSGVPSSGIPTTTTTTALEGQTLDDIAKAAGTDAGTLKNLNPGLGNGGLPAGTQVTVPAPPAQGGAGAPGQPQGTPPVNIKQPDPLPVTSDVINVQAIQLPIVTPGDIISIIFSNRPQAPTSLQVGFKDCTVQMQWYDNATNETHFNIWMQRIYGPPQLIATTGANPQNGPTRFDFASPSFGIYSFWVEAANALSSQSSEVKYVWVSDSDCTGGVATYLEIEALDMYIFGPYGQIYCYLSLDGTPEKRIPENAYIQVQNDWGDITKHWGGEKRVLFPMPADEELTLEGECWGFQGTLLVNLGSFQANVPSSKWDGSRLELKTDSFLVGYRVQPAGSKTAHGRFQYVDYGLPSPQIWDVKAQGELQIPEKDWKARTVTLTWHWSGRPEQINSFLILIDGEEVRYVNRLQAQESILLGSACGQKYSFTIEAVGAGGARSVPSTPYSYQQPPCPVMAEVKFLTAKSNVTDDLSCKFPIMSTCFSYKGCDQIDIWYELFALGAGHDPVYIYGGAEQFPMPYKCGIEYQFTKQLGADRDTIIVPIDPALPEVRVGTTFWESDVGPTDKFGLTGMDIKHAYADWPSVDEDFVLTAGFMDGTADMTVKGHIRGFYYAGP